jgi:hypothetical protein
VCTGGNGVGMVACKMLGVGGRGGGLFGVILGRGDFKLFQVLPPGFWGGMVK